MYKAKAWLHSQGHIATAGRGRPPRTSMKDGREIQAILHEASKSGVKFIDWPKGKVEVTTAKDSGESQVKVIRDKVSSGNTVVELAPYRFPEDEFKVVESASGKTRSLKEACNICRVSLVGHFCDDPRIVARDGSGSVAVTIRRK